MIEITEDELNAELDKLGLSQNTRTPLLSEYDFSFIHKARGMHPAISWVNLSIWWNTKNQKNLGINAIRGRYENACMIKNISMNMRVRNIK